VAPYPGMLHTASALVGRADRKARKSWISQKVVNKMGDMQGRQQRRKTNYRTLKNELKRTTDKAKN
jgi:hypothetical protein